MNRQSSRGSRLGRGGALSFAALLSVGAAANTGRAAPLSLMPVPASVQQQTGMLSVSGGIAVVWQNARSPLLERAAARFAAGAARLSGVAATVPGTRPATLTVVCHGADPGYLAVGEKEHYRLSVDGQGVRLEADGPGGVLDGFSTLLQLLQHGPDGLALPFVVIDDAPRFAWRGLMIDVSRHFMTVPTLERQIDAMERVKLDVLHLHLSDSQGWRVESRLYPRLQQLGSHGQFYSQTEIRGIVAYAADRGIRVVPEFDLPGHALALLQAYPALSATPPDRLPKDFDPNQAALDPSNPDTLRMVSRLYGEMAGLFPDMYFHAGGDEVSGGQWTGVPRIAAYMKAHGIADADKLQAQFTVAVQKVLAARHKTMIGWDEVVAAPIPAGVAVQVWRSSKWIATAAKAGHPVIVSAGYYLDLMQPSAQHYGVDPLDPHAVGMSETEARKAVPVTGPKAMDFARDDSVTMDAADDAHVLGGEAALWTEIVSDEMLDSRLWPRAAAIAERFWSKAEVRDVPDMMRRLAATEDRLCAMGLQSQDARTRMTERLAPGASAPVARLLEAVAPARNYTLHNAELEDRTGGHPLALNGLADIATPDDEPGLRFAALAARFEGGERAVGPELRAILMRWRDNDAAFEAVSAGNGVLEAARPVSHDLRALAVAGLHALDRLEGSDPNMGWVADADGVIGRQSVLMANSAGLTANLSAPPVDGLLMPVVAPIAALVSAAKRVPEAAGGNTANGTTKPNHQ